MNVLLDSGFMIIILFEKKYKSFLDKLELRELFVFGLQILVVDGLILQYKGFIECIMKFLDFEFFVFIVIVFEIEFNKNCFVIVGINILRICREYFLYVFCQLLEVWQLVIDSIQCRLFCVKVIIKRDIILELYQLVVVNGVVKGIDKNIFIVVIENLQRNDNYIVCLRVLILL